MDNVSGIYEMLCQFYGADENEVAFALYKGENVENISYRQFLVDILKATAYFRNRQIYGQHIALISPNSYEWIVTFIATIVSGNISVPMNLALPNEMLKEQCVRAKISFICGEEQILPRLDSVCSEVPSCSFDEMLKMAPVPMELACRIKDDDDVALMLFTSGTTGKSKIVMLSVRKMLFSADNTFVQKRNGASDERDMVALPLYHVGMLRNILNRLCRRKTCCLGRGSQYLFMDMPKLQPTTVAMVPAMAESLVKIVKRASDERLTKIVGERFATLISCGASLKPSIAEFFVERGIQIETLYGMTESGGHGSWCILEKNHLNTIGKPEGDISFRIQDGEIMIKSEAVMLGYYEDPEETEKVIVDGWLHTGDMGYCDEEGYYYITGRKKNVIILSNGENVNPEEIEMTLSMYDAIEECLVYSDGKGICADIFTKDSESATACVKKYNDTMPMYRQVYKVNYTADPLPKTGSGKIKRKENV